MKNTFSDRKYNIGAIIVIVGLIILLRLFFLQVVDLTYKISADNNSQRYETQYPARGLIFDRKGELLVDNQTAYDLMVVPQQLEPFDTTELCELLQVTKKQFVEEINKAKRYSYYKPSVVAKQLSARLYAALQEKLYKYTGFSVQTRTLRKYPTSIASHLLGYVGEVNDRVIQNEPYYKSGDYIGISGIEKSYESDLRGAKGVNIYLVDVHSRIKGSYKDGQYNTIAISGADITTTLDAQLQEYGEKLMQNKRGSIVAIEPSTGEILAYISSPTYNPNLLVGRARTLNYKILSNDKNDPLFDRASMAEYPPGSTFKLINGLIGLQEGIITSETRFTCSGGYHVGSFTVGCHHDASFDLRTAIQLSCNAYFCNVFRKILDDKKFINVGDGFHRWREHVLSFGLGKKTNSDIPSETSGYIPDNKRYDKFYGVNRWKSLMLVSLAIGQGELGITPFQMANMTAAIANRGYYFIPHIVKAIKGKESIPQRFSNRLSTTISPQYFTDVIDGMELVVKSGTAFTAWLPDIVICGKTGTAQNPHGEDHSIFNAFAPKDNPKIVIAVYVENAGFGAYWAAPIASLMIEKYIKGKVSRHSLEQRISETNLMETTKRVDKNTY